eukprot:Clim_evm64s218 gene=Clim_evmTU64s218
MATNQQGTADEKGEYRRSGERKYRAPVVKALGSAIPEHPHSVSVCMPSWEDNVDYEEGKDRVHSKLQSGYPRFAFSPVVKDLFAHAAERFCDPTKEQSVLVLPNETACRLCAAFMVRLSERSRAEDQALKAGTEEADDMKASVLDLPTAEFSDFKWHPLIESTDIGDSNETDCNGCNLSELAELHAFVLPAKLFGMAKSFWQHTGYVVTSRQAVSYLKYVNRQPCGSEASPRVMTPKSTSGSSVEDEDDDGEEDLDHHIEEHFGRRLKVTESQRAQDLICKRIGKLTAQRSDHVHLYPCGMNAFFHAYATVRDLAGGHDLEQHEIVEKSDGTCVMFGFPYLDSLKTLQKFAPITTGMVSLQESVDSTVKFLGHGGADDYDELERFAEDNKIVALFCEFPTNPLLRCPDLERISAVAKRHNFPVVVDDTIGNFHNLQITKSCDMIVTSLTKLFSGDSDVMGGSIVVNGNSAFASAIQERLKKRFSATRPYSQDIIALERNSRDFERRSVKINQTASRLAEYLHNHDLVDYVCYPSLTEPEIYGKFKKPDGGYGGLMSVILKDAVRAPKFYDALNVSKGPSLGTNFTLCCPYTILAHYTELDFAAGYGVPAHLVRISIGLESYDDLKEAFDNALKAAAQ